MSPAPPYADILGLAMRPHETCDDNHLPKPVITSTYWALIDLLDDRVALLNTFYEVACKLDVPPDEIRDSLERLVLLGVDKQEIAMFIADTLCESFALEEGEEYDEDLGTYTPQIQAMIMLRAVAGAYVVLTLAMLSALWIASRAGLF